MQCDCCGTTVDESSDGVTANGSEAVLSRPLPDELGRELGEVYDAEPVETYRDWLETMVAAMGREPTVEDMCCVDGARHRVETRGELEEYVCVVDPLAVPFRREEPAVVRSSVPGSDATVTARVDADGDLTVDPETAVVSFGAASDAGEDVLDPVERGYVALCEYTHAFPDEERYEDWAAETEAVTTSMAYADAAALAAAVAELV